MADRVQYVLDRMAPTLRKLLSLGMFDQKEIRSIVKSRTNFEYVLLRRRLCVEDFLRYLEYEMNLQQLQRVRQRRLKLKRVTDIEGQSIKHISYIFERGVRRFPKDLKLWNAYVDYCESSKQKELMSSVLTRALVLLPREESLWIRAATYESVDQNNPRAARVLMQRALRVNKKSKTLFLFYFKQEIVETIRLRERRRARGLPLFDETLDVPVELGEKDAALARILRGRIPMLVFDHALSNIADDRDFALALLDIAWKHKSDMQDVISSISSQLKLHFGDDPVIYVHIASAHLEDWTVPHNDANSSVAEALAILQEACQKMPTAHMRCASAHLLMNCALSAPCAEDMEARLKILRPLLEDWLILQQIPMPVNGEKHIIATLVRLAALKVRYMTAAASLPHNLLDKDSQDVEYMDASSLHTLQPHVRRCVLAHESLHQWLSTARHAWEREKVQLIGKDEAVEVCKVATEALLALQRLLAWVCAESGESDRTSGTLGVNALREYVTQRCGFLYNVCMGLRMVVCLTEEGTRLLLQLLEDASLLSHANTQRLLDPENVYRDIIGFVSTQPEAGVIETCSWCTGYVQHCVRAGVSVRRASDWILRSSLALAKLRLVQTQSTSFIRFFCMCADAELCEADAHGKGPSEDNLAYKHVCELLEEGLRVCCGPERSTLFSRLLALHLRLGRVDLAGQTKLRAQREGVLV